MKSFTLVTTVFNEMRRLNDTIADVEAQTLHPDEIVIVDAGSRDGTYERLLQWNKESSLNIVVLQHPKCNVAEGRNIAIKAATHELIASTDFGCRYQKNWLKSLMTPFFEDDTVRLTCGSFTCIETDVTTWAGKADYILQNGYKVALDEYFVPSSRSIAYYKSVWQEAGEYPEWLTLAADDTIFWYVIAKKKIPALLIAEPNVYWLRHKSYKGFGKESWRYGLGQGEGRIAYRNFWSMSIETAMRWTLPFNLILILGLYLSGFAYWYATIPILVLQTFGLRSYIFAWRRWQGVKSPKYNFSAFLCTFYMIEVTRFYHIKGYIQGYWFGTPKRKEEAGKLAALLNAA